MIAALTNDPIKINAIDRTALLLGLERRGFEIRDLFFKCNENFYDKYAPLLGRKSDQPGKFMELDFKRLCEIHEILPKNTVTPVAMVISNEWGYVAGYLTEFIFGMDLSALHNKAAGTRDPRLIKQYVELVHGVESAVNKMHLKGIPHGDLAESNIRIGTDGTFRFVDPIHFKKVESGMMHDRIALEALLRDAHALLR